MTKEVFKKYNVTTLRSKSKEDLICHIEDLYRERASFLEAISYIEKDIELIKCGESHRVHDNP